MSEAVKINGHWICSDCAKNAYILDLIDDKPSLFKCIDPDGHEYSLTPEQNDRLHASGYVIRTYEVAT